MATSVSGLYIPPLRTKEAEGVRPPQNLGTTAGAPPSATKIPLKEAGLLRQEDYLLISQKPNEAKEFWRVQHNKAFKLQETQRIEWRNFKKGFTQDEDGGCPIGRDTIEGFQQAFNKWANSGKEELQKINQDIGIHNSSPTCMNPECFGYVEEIPLQEPCLDTQGDFEIIARSPESIKAFAPHYTYAHYLQATRNAWMLESFNYSTEKDRLYLAEMEGINVKLEIIASKYFPKLKQGKKHQKGNMKFSVLEVPQNSAAQDLPCEKAPENEEDSGGAEDISGGEDGGEYSEEEFVATNSEEVVAILGTLSGTEGTLRKRLQAKDTKEQAELEVIMSDVFTQANNESKRQNPGKEVDIGVSLKSLLRFYAGYEHAGELYSRIQARPNNTKLRNQYEGLREGAIQYVTSNVLPLDWIDTIVPPLEGEPGRKVDPRRENDQGRKDDEMKEAKKTTAMHHIIDGIGGQNGMLNCYIESQVSGKEDLKSQEAILHVQQELQNGGHHTALKFFSQEGLDMMVQAHGVLRDLVKRGASQQEFHGVNNEFVARYAGFNSIQTAIVGRLTKPQKPPPPGDQHIDLELRNQAFKIRKPIEGHKGPLSKLLHSRHPGQIDKQAKIKVDGINSQLQNFCRENEILNIFSINESTFSAMLECVNTLNNLQAECRKNVDDSDQLSIFLNAMKEAKDRISSSGGYSPGLEDAMLGEFRNNKYRKPLSKSSREKGVIEAPSAERDDSEFMEIRSGPADIIEERVGSLVIKMRIIGRRKAGYGFHFLLKYFMPNKTKPCHELVRTGLYPGANTAYAAMVTDELLIVEGKKVLETVSWTDQNQPMIGGIAYTRRDENGIYLQQARGIVFLRLIADSQSLMMWFLRDACISVFGNRFLAAEREFTRLSGQRTPIAPWAWKDVKTILARAGPVPKDPKRAERMRRKLGSDLAEKRRWMESQKKDKSSREKKKRRSNESEVEDTDSSDGETLVDSDEEDDEESEEESEEEDKRVDDTDSDEGSDYSDSDSGDDDSDNGGKADFIDLQQSGAYKAEVKKQRKKKKEGERAVKEATKKMERLRIEEKKLEAEHARKHKGKQRNGRSSSTKETPASQKRKHKNVGNNTEEGGGRKRKGSKKTS